MLTPLARPASSFLVYTMLLCGCSHALDPKGNTTSPLCRLSLSGSKFSCIPRLGVSVVDHKFLVIPGTSTVALILSPFPVESCLTIGRQLVPISADNFWGYPQLLVVNEGVANAWDRLSDASLSTRNVTIFLSGAGASPP